MLLGMWEGRKHSVLESYLFQYKREEDILGLVHFYSLWIRQNWNALSDDLDKWCGDNSCAIIPKEKMPKLNAFHLKGVSCHKMFYIRKMAWNRIFLVLFVIVLLTWWLKTNLLWKWVWNQPICAVRALSLWDTQSLTQCWGIQNTHSPLGCMPLQRSFSAPAAQQYFSFLAWAPHTAVQEILTSFCYKCFGITGVIWWEDEDWDWLGVRLSIHLEVGWRLLLLIEG